MRTAIFACNWSAFPALTEVGASARDGQRVIRVMCASQVHPGHILQAFENGAEGVLILGCPEEECRFDQPSKALPDHLGTTQRILRLLGINEQRLRLVHARPEEVAAEVQNFEREVAGFGSWPQ